MWRNNTDLLRPLTSQFLDNQEYRTHREHHLCLFQLQVQMAAGSCHSLSSWGSMLGWMLMVLLGINQLKRRLHEKQIIMDAWKYNLKNTSFLGLQ